MVNPINNRKKKKKKKEKEKEEEEEKETKRKGNIQFSSDFAGFSMRRSDEVIC